jgi:hypothetical protein
MEPYGGIHFNKTYTLGTYKLSPRAGGLLLVFFGLLFASIGLFIELNTQVFLQGAISTNGMIVSCEMDGNECQPTFQFQTRSGRTVTIKDTNSSSSWSQGEIITVDYHPNDPQDAGIDMGSLWLWFVIPGSCIVLLGLGTYVRGVLSSKKRVS